MDARLKHFSSGRQDFYGVVRLNGQKKAHFALAKAGSGRIPASSEGPEGQRAFPGSGFAFWVTIYDFYKRVFFFFKGFQRPFGGLFMSIYIYISRRVHLRL